jgi:peptidoglycan/LPS O-acetylase OafA/YrhL
MEKIGYFNYCLNILWSLSVEEVFYIAFPIVCLFFKKMRFIIPFWIALIIIAPIYRSFHAHNEIIAVYGYFSCFDAIALGCCAAIVAPKIRLCGWLSNIVEYSAWSLLVVVYLQGGIMQNVVVGFSLIALSTAILLLVANQDRPQRNNSFNPLTNVVCWFGKNSYELYLFHIIVLALMKEIYDVSALGDYSKILWLGVFLITSSIVAGNISRFYSIPMNKKLRDFLSSLRLQKAVRPSTIEGIPAQLDR